MKLGQRYAVTWLDAWQNSSQDWHKLGKVKCSPYKMRTLGYVVAKSKHYVVLAQTYDKYGKQYCGLFHIPKAWIFKVKKL